jgi:hypothetical protein
MAQVERATSKAGKQYLKSSLITDGEDFINLGENCSIGNNLALGNTLVMPLYEPADLLELLQIATKGQKGIKFGQIIDGDYPSDTRNAFITFVDRQFFISGTSGVPANESIVGVIKANTELRLLTGNLSVNGETGLTATQTFKDAAGVNKTMTITNGIITGIS